MKSSAVRLLFPIGWIIGALSFPAAAADGIDAPTTGIPATTDDGLSVILFQDGTWVFADDAADPEDGDHRVEPTENDAPAVLALRDLIETARDRRGETVVVDAQIRCFSERDCDVVAQEGAFYARENVSVSIEALDRSARLDLVNSCGRFDPRCPVRLVATVDFTRYDSLVLRAESVER